MTLKPVHTIEPLEGRRLFAANALLGINFTDETGSDDHFAYSVAQAKELGVGAVRIWLGIKNYDDRPNAWDSDPKYMSIGLDNKPLSGGYQRAIDRAFELKHLGFKVMMSVVPDQGIVPTTTAQVTGFFTHLLSCTQYQGGTETMRDVVDQWEIGNEPDLTGYWADSSGGVTAGLKSYVDKLLIPASSVLHSGSTWEPVISAGVSNKPDDLNTILTYLNSKGKISAIDYAGFHPYATFNPDVANANQQATNILLAKSYADNFGKKMIATEWNIRGFVYTGADDVRWAKALDLNYRNYILPYFDSSYYFTMVNNYAYRGGTTSARPAGLHEHDTTLAVSPTSHPDIQADYQATPLITAEPYFSTFNKWQFGTIRGTVTDQTNGQRYSDALVYIDQNNTGNYELGEAAAITDLTGNYEIGYSIGDVAPGNYPVRAFSLFTTAAARNAATVAVGSLGSASGVNFALEANYFPPASSPTGSITGLIYHDFNGNGDLEDLDRSGGIQQVYIDLNDNSIYDIGEPTSLSASDTGKFKITFDASVVDGNNHAVRVSLLSGWSQTESPLVQLSLADQYIGTTVGLLPNFQLGARTKGSISGFFFSDTNNNGVQDSGEALLANRVAYIDANNNGVRDTGEYAVLNWPSTFTGQYFLRNLSAGTYIVRTEATGTEAITTPASYTITLNTDDRLSGFKFGIGTGGNIPSSTGSIAGTCWGDNNSNGTIDSGEALAGSRVAFLDTNRNLKLDTGEKSVTTDASGNYKFSGLTPGTYYVTRVFPTGYKLSNNALGYLTVTVTSGLNVTGVNIGSVAGTTTGGGGGTGTVTTASIAGYLWNDNNGNGVQDGTETRVAARVVYIDTNNNSILDSSEKQLTTDSTGSYKFSSLAAGTYRIRRVLPTGYKVVSPSVGYQLVTVIAGQVLTGVNLGSKLA